MRESSKEEYDAAELQTTAYIMIEKDALQRIIDSPYRDINHSGGDGVVPLGDEIYIHTTPGHAAWIKNALQYLDGDESAAEPTKPPEMPDFRQMIERAALQRTDPDGVDEHAPPDD
jgi:hypothetical protein